jgi:alkanesulfonate monooxygenase SsuD/methylene tetrahydromethanopterin reductase-like flavin-dependent oxidoreductase (luciferase family)
MSKWHRDPYDLKVMPGILVVVAPTRQEAQDKFDYLQDLIHPEIGVGLLSRRIEVDLSGYPVDGPVPDIPDDVLRNSRSGMMFEAARRENLTIRQLYKRFAASRGHLSVTGTPGDIADVMQQWLEGGAADGFNIMPTIFPSGLDDFVDLVVPELQRRGIFRTRYEGVTLRQNLGLNKPVSRYVSSRREQKAWL